MKTTSIYIKLWLIIHKPKMILGLITSLCSTLMALYIPSFIGGSLDESLLLELSHNGELLFSLFIILLLTYLFQAVSSYLLSSSSNDATLVLQQELIQHVLRLPVSRFKQYRAGDLTSRVTNDMIAVSKLFAVVLPQLLVNSLLLVGSIFFLFTISVRLTLLCFLLLPLLAVVILPLVRQLEKKYLKQQELLGTLTSRLTDRLSKMILVKSYQGELEEASSFLTITNLFKKNFNAIIRTSILQMMLTQILAFSGVFMLILSATSLVQEGKLTIGSLLAFILYLFQLLAPLFNIVEAMEDVGEIKGINKRLGQVFQETVEDMHQIDSMLPLVGDLVFKEFSFSHQDNKNLISSLTFTLPYGSHLLLIGSSGSGKTSLLLLLLHYLNDYKGSLTIAGEELRDIDISRLRNRLAYMSQDSPLLLGSLRDNLLYGKNKQASKEKLKELLSALDLDDCLAQLPQGLDTVLSDVGTELSAGEKQRFCLARTLLSDADLYLFDEVTANLDKKTAALVHAAINHYCQGKTRITITHHRHQAYQADYYLKWHDSGRVQSGIID